LTLIGGVRVGDAFPVRIMGIINVSPESFYNESVKTSAQSISETASNMQDNGADIIDIGAMSTAPYIETIVSTEEEIRRMRYGIEVVKNSCELPISADTPRSEVAKEAIRSGADAINDVTGLKYDRNMANIVADSGLPVIICAHSRSRRNNKDSHRFPSHRLGRISATIKLLKESLVIAEKAKVSEDKIIIDPSIGFFRMEGKGPFFTKMEDLPWYIRDIEVISKLEELKIFSKPICVSVSRKSFIGHLFGLKAKERLIPSIISEVISVINGANLIRTHNIQESLEALTMTELLH
jgi:dihydropteroate synthase